MQPIYTVNPLEHNPTPIDYSTPPPYRSWVDDFLRWACIAMLGFIVVNVAMMVIL